MSGSIEIAGNLIDPATLSPALRARISPEKFNPLQH